MNARERIRHVLRGGTADRLPRAIFGGGLWSYRQSGLRIDSLKEDPAGFGDRLADLWGGLDTDIVFLGSGMNTLPAEAIGGELAFGTGQAPLLSFPIIQSAEDACELDRIDLEASPCTLVLVEMMAQVRRRLPERYLCAYRDVVLPRQKELFDGARSAGTGCFLHQCGKIAAQVGLYPETGADCVSLDAGVSIGEIYDSYQARVTTAGNVDVVTIVRGADEAALRTAVASCVSAVETPLTRYVLMPSCDLPADTRIGNVRAFLAGPDR